MGRPSPPGQGIYPNFMSTRNWSGKSVDNPRGAWPDTALVRKGNPSRGNISRNVRFAPGRAYSREGTSAVFSSSGKVTGLWQWLAPTTSPQSLVLYQDGTVLKRRNLADSSTATLYSSLGGMRAPSFADLAANCYFCGYTATGAAAIQCRIHDGNITSGTPDADLAFRGPLTVSAFTGVDGGAGFCTAGTRKIGFVYTSRTGFTGAPCPVVVSTFTPISVTLNAGLRTINVSITLDTPTDAGGIASITPIMTRTDNLAKWFFVPPIINGEGGGYAPDPVGVPYNTLAWTLNFTISISDEDLANSATPADEQFNLVAGGLSCNFVSAYGKRMTYGAGTKVYVSDVDDPQHITEAFHTINLPSQRQIAYGFQLGNNYFLTGDKWTGRTRDNGDQPATWEQPSMVSDTIGAPFPGCVGPFGDGLTKKWIASEAGLYLFDGTFPSHPITYYWSSYWARINWSAAYAVQIDNDPTALRCYVAIPLDGATEPSHLLTIDYTNGERFDQCDISIDDFPAGFSSIRMVKEYLTARSVLWIGPSAAGNVVHFDPTVHNDVGAAIHSTWESGYVRQGGEFQAKTIRVGNMDLWLQGGGTAPTITWYGLDRVQSVTPAIMGAGSAIVTTLSAAPGLEYFCKGNLSPIENYSVRVDSNTSGAFWSLSGFKAYARPSLYVR